MANYLETFINGYKGYANYLWQDIINPTWGSYFYWLILVSLVFFVFEFFLPWRKGQSIVRKDFFLDLFYMFFNFFLFSLIIYNAASDVFVNLFNDGIGAVTGFDLQANNPLLGLPHWQILLVGFFLRDFVQWWIHRLLHKSETLWEFHKVHHSVEEMGFAAHLRYHWMENVVYRSLEYIPLALLGIGLHDFFVIHIFTLAWGHFNHSNMSVKGWVTGGILGILIGIVFANGLLDITFAQQDGILYKTLVILVMTGVGAIILGPFMRILFNSPEMHIWHHSYDLPPDRQTGVNFGLTLAIWDYIFKTNYIPHNGRDIRLGFPGVEEFPDNFAKQVTHGFRKSALSVEKHKSEFESIKKK